MAMSDLWYENAIIYCLDVETFMDSDGDGIGDFKGLTRRLDYLSSLGVTCLWLMPCFPTPNNDDGYDVTDYCAIDPRLGTLADFVEFTREAADRGMRVIVDLVANHTSDEHPWFQAARRDPESPYRDYYVWREDDPGDTSHEVVFPGEQDGIWSFDDEAGAWYLHHFYHFQPDLNMTNPKVRDELRRTMGLWLQLGVSGFRVDAAPFLINPLGVDRSVDVHDTHVYLEDMREFLSHRQGDAIMLGEVDVGPTQIAEYFGEGNEFQLLFNFLLNRDLFLSLAIESPDPLRLSLEELPSIPNLGQWVNFLRHHDELNLSRLTEQERQTVFKAFALDEDMQIYDRGLRRRLAPMLKGNRRRLELAYSLLFSLPGTPMIFYGEEIGMGENLDVPARGSVRTPMQWSSAPNGGFSTANAADLVRPMRAEKPYGYRGANVTDQRQERNSLLNWMAHLIRARKECPEFGWGDAEIIRTDVPSVLAQRSHWKDGGVAVAAHNFSREACDVTLELPGHTPDEVIDLLGDRDYERMRGNSFQMRMEGYGYRWMRLGELR
ncbi:MAG TPA: alpha-amylase family protein [Thermomicrobiales bacterium]|nr:alpha-amylase family protein [Thermomicrobiales bacterium]